MNDLSAIAGPLARQPAPSEDIRKAAREMEALFAYEMLKAMHAGASLAGGGLGGETYMTLFELELSRIMAERGLGLSGTLEKGLGALGSAAGRNPGAAPAAVPANGRSSSAEVSVVEDGVVSSGYGLRQDPFTGAVKFHHGLDIAAPANAEVRPILAGIVEFSGERKGYGNVVVIDHGNGLKSTYAHNQVNLVQKGDRVEPATAISRVGTTGRSTGPHVHLEVELDGERLDPRGVLAAQRA